MKAEVDPNICIGCTLCTQTCPEVFSMVDGKSVAIVNLVPKDAQARCQQAADECPVNAISLE